MANKRKVIPLHDEAVEPGTSSRKPLVKIAYDRLTEGIRDGTLRPGQRILESEIADWLKMSRTPVREALRRLVDKDLLSYDRYGSLVITQFDRPMIIEIFTMRAVLEGAVARLAARHAYDEEVEAMLDIVDSFAKKQNERSELKQSDRDELARLNMLLRKAVAQASHNRYLIRAFESLPRPVRPLATSGHMSKERAAAIAEEYKRLVTAIANRDPDEAEAAARKHVEESRRYWLMMLNKKETKK